MDLANHSAIKIVSKLASGILKYVFENMSLVSSSPEHDVHKTIINIVV
ncbi:hypothetical protein LCL86_12295 [Muricauda ruestringensis]|nr:hypothetical protein [Allomuricauda ruestringensis]MCA0959831.1 hypothetical protein [Allomuricauda ruestringensis]